VEKMTEVT